MEFALPDLEGRTHIFKIHTRPMSLEPGIRWGPGEGRAEAGMDRGRGRSGAGPGHLGGALTAPCLLAPPYCRPPCLAPHPRFELLARLCPNSTGADIRSVSTEAGMFAIRWVLQEVVLPRYCQLASRRASGQARPGQAPSAPPPLALKAALGLSPLQRCSIQLAPPGKQQMFLFCGAQAHVACLLET